MYILFDIGGTNMRVARSEDGDSIDEVRKVKTPDTFEEGMSEVRTIAIELAGGETFDAIAGGVAGVMEKGVLVSAPHLPLWRGHPVEETLKTLFNIPAYVENDTALGALGEAHIGAGRGYEIVAYVAVGTGVGGARIVDGRIDRKRYGFEPGHQIVQGGELEKQVSGSAFEKRLGVHPKEVPQESNEWNESARILAMGLTNTILHWSPDVCVLGGSMILGTPAISFEGIKENMASFLTIFPELPQIRKAELGDNAGLEGARIYCASHEGF